MSVPSNIVERLERAILNADANGVTKVKAADLRFVLTQLSREDEAKPKKP